jgi:hypothetical protein
VSRQQPIPAVPGGYPCVQSSPVAQPRRESQDPKSASVAEVPPSDSSPETNSLRSDELAALHGFFELLSQWDESLKGEIKHE